LNTHTVWLTAFVVVVGLQSWYRSWLLCSWYGQSIWSSIWQKGWYLCWDWL